MRKTDAALFTTYLGGGGAERVMANLAEGLSKYRISVDLVLTRAGPKTYMVSDRVRVVDLEAPRIYASLPKVVRYLRNERPRVLLSADTPVNVTVLLAWRMSRVPTRVVVSEHIAVTEHFRNTKDWRVRLLPKIARSAYPWADAVVTVSKGVAKSLIGMVPIPKDKLHVIYNPVVSDAILQKAEEPLEHPWFAAGQPPVILGVGRLATQKDFPTLIRAFALVHKKLPARLLILGEGPDRPELEALVRQLGLEDDVVMPGFVDNPFKYMRRAAVFVLSSKWEGLPTVLIEAMACGCPVVSTDCPSGPVEILENGKWGRLVPVGDTEALADAIIKALEEPSPNTAARIREFSIDHAVQRYIRVLWPNGYLSDKSGTKPRESDEGQLL